MSSELPGNVDAAAIWTILQELRLYSLASLLSSYNALGVELLPRTPLQWLNYTFISTNK